MRNWVRKDVNFKKALQNTSDRLNIPVKEIESIIIRYLHRCRTLLLGGHKIQLPGIIYAAVYKTQLKKMRKFMSYSQLKKRYGKSDHFKKYVAKKKKT